MSVLQRFLGHVEIERGAGIITDQQAQQFASLLEKAVPQILEGTWEDTDSQGEHRGRFPEGVVVTKTTSERGDHG